MFGWLFKKSFWPLATLADMAAAVRWLEVQRRKGQQEQALVTYCRAITPQIRQSIDRYEDLVRQLDERSGGLFSDPESIRRMGPKAGGANLLQNLHAHGEWLRNYFDRVAALKGGDFQKGWTTILGSRSEYFKVLGKLVGEFGNFEVLLPTLPGTGEMTADPAVQGILEEMYHINTQNLRRLELMHDVLRSWTKKPEEMCLGFFEPETDFRRIIGTLLYEYMVEADPMRIDAKKKQAAKSGKSYQPYRFWRAAENFRLMAQVAYLDGAQRRPYAQRKYVEVDLEHVPPILTDIRRLEWSIKEVFNNSLSGSSIMYSNAEGIWIAQPLERHKDADAHAAIRITLEGMQRKIGWRRQDFMRLKIRDEGIGIDAEHVEHVTKWGYSPRREEFRRKAQDEKMSNDRAYQEIQIGGKGIGLAYARDVFREHGGDLSVSSLRGEHTTVTIDLPIPTPMSIEP